MAKNTRNTPSQLPENVTLHGSNALPAKIEISSGNFLQLGDVVTLAFQKSGLQPDAWNELPDADRDVALNAMIDDLKQAAVGAAEGAREALNGHLGPRVRQEVRYAGRTYAPGERLPADIDEDILDELEVYNAI